MRGAESTGRRARCCLLFAVSKTSEVALSPRLPHRVWLSTKCETQKRAYSGSILGGGRLQFYLTYISMYMCMCAFV